jgi:hypothetical protein
VSSVTEAVARIFPCASLALIKPTSAVILARLPATSTAILLINDCDAMSLRLHHIRDSLLDLSIQASYLAQLNWWTFRLLTHTTTEALMLVSVALNWKATIAALKEQTMAASVLLTHLPQQRDALQQDSEMFNKLIGEMAADASKRAGPTSEARIPACRGSGFA